MARIRARRTLAGLHKVLVQIRFRELESFIQHTRDSMEAAWAEYSDQFDSKTARWSEDEIAVYVDQVYDDLAALRDDSPQLLRHAQCMVVYGAFENAIAGLCRALHRDNKIARTPPKNLHMDDVRGYLRAHLSTRPAPFAKDWQWMHEFRIIRNWMAHNGGIVQKDKNPNGNWAQAQRFARRNRGLIKYVGRGDILVEDGLVDRALIKAESAFGRLQTTTTRLH